MTKSDKSKSENESKTDESEVVENTYKVHSHGTAPQTVKAVTEKAAIEKVKGGTKAFRVPSGYKFKAVKAEK